jgi:hypothetical protein
MESKEDQMNSRKYYISVTGLVCKSLFTTPKFFWYSTPAFRAAARADGIVHTSGLSYKDAHMTLSVWESKNSMSKFMRGKEHIAAMKVLKDVSSYGKIHGYFGDSIPSSEEAIAAWKKDGRLVHGDPNTDYGDEPETATT